MQRRGIIDAESIEKLRTSAYFTTNSNLFNETMFDELEQTNPRDEKAEKQYQKLLRGRNFIVNVIDELKKHESDEVFLDYAMFEAKLKSILFGIEGYSASRLTGIAMAMSVIDKNAIIQRDRKGNIRIDPTTKDTEIIRLNQNEAKYMQTEVYPYVPDAIYRYEYDPNKTESSTNRERKGAEFPFVRYFYEYIVPDDSQSLLDQFHRIGSELKKEIETLR